MNVFYKQPVILQWIEAILLMIIGFYPAIIILEKGSSNALFYLLLILYLPFGQFTLTPLFKLSGIYTYYSPMLLGYMVNKEQIDLHSGGSFDYLFVMRKFKTGTELRNRILIYHLEGLLKIINLIENNSISPQVNVVATSYFFNERTIEKFGFEFVKPTILYRINLLVNFIDLTWMYSIAKGKFSFPKIYKAKKVKVSGDKLVSKKGLILELHERMILNRKLAYRKA